MLEKLVIGEVEQVIQKILRSRWPISLDCQVRLAGPRRARMWHRWALNAIFVLLTEDSKIIHIASKIPTEGQSDSLQMSEALAVRSNLFEQGHI